MESVTGTRVAIIGGGLAGLSAAYRLKQASGHDGLPQIESVVFEATDRVGGRVRTLRYPSGLYAEAGASFITDNETSLLALVDEMGLNLITRDEARHPQFFVEGKLTTYDPSKEVMRLLFSEMIRLTGTQISHPGDWCLKQTRELEALDQIRLVDFCLQNSLSSMHIKRALSATPLGLLTDDIASVSALSAFRMLSQYHRVNTLYSIEQGNDRLSQALANTINDNTNRIVLNTPVSCISRVNHQWEVSGKQGRSAYADLFDYVILATPLSTLQSHQERAIKLPGLPGTYRQAIDAIQYNQSIVRVYCEVDHRFWAPLPTAAVITDSSSCWICDHSAKQEGRGAILEAYFAGERGRRIQEALDPANAGERAIIEIYGQAFRTHLKPESTKVVLWSKRPYQWGTCPQFGINQRALLSRLATPVEGSLFFIGADLSLESPMSMQGAVSSGEDIVEQVLLPFIREGQAISNKTVSPEHAA